MSTPNEPSAEDLRGAPVLPGFEVPEIVALGPAVVHAQGLQPEDIGVLAWLKLRDPRKPATKAQLQKEMQEQGWKMGKDRFEGIFQRLKATGRIKHHCPYNPETGRPEWRIEFYLNPANNDEYVNSGISAFQQVSDEMRETRNPQTEQPFESRETRITPGQSGMRETRNPGAECGKPAFPSEGVPAGQGRNAGNPVFGPPPPHPPEEEVGTTSPSPHKPATASRRDKQAPPDVAPADAAAAAQFVMRLPGPWAVGLQRAQGLAPWLVHNAELTGWSLDAGLRAYLTRPEPDKGPIKNYGATLAYRIKDMQPRDKVLEAAAADNPQQEEQQGSAKPALPAWCGECDSADYRWIVPEEGTARQCPNCNPVAIARSRTGA